MYKPEDAAKHIKIEKNIFEPEFKDKGFRAPTKEWS